MPLHDLKCQSEKCQHVYETVLFLTEAVPPCPLCGGTCIKLPGSNNFAELTGGKKKMFHFQSNRAPRHVTRWKSETMAQGKKDK